MNDQTINFSSATQKFQPLPFNAPFLLRNGHSMTIFAALYQRTFSALPVAEKREFHTTADTTVIGYCHWQANRLQHKTILQIHGLEGDAERHYMMGTAEKAWRAGFNVIRMNVRNCGGTEHLTPTLYHSGLTADIKSILKILAEEDHLPAIFLIGFSMGGNQSLKYAGEVGADAPAQLKGICAISPPIDLEICSLALRETRNYIYDVRFLRGLKERIRVKEKHFPNLVDWEKLSRVQKLWDFDDVVTAPHFGFRNGRDYYTQSSSKPYLAHIRVPTLIIQAKDDPFIPFTPFQEITRNDYVQLLAHKYGGHVGFWHPRSNGNDHYWAEQVAVDYCASVKCEL